MTVKYSKHALFRIRVRKIRKQRIALAIANPESAYQDLESDTMVAIKQFTTRYLVVFFSHSASEDKVVTLYYASDVSSLISRKLRRGAWVKRKA